jgi:type II secretory pathway pseudopilin PulG
MKLLKARTARLQNLHRQKGVGMVELGLGLVVIAIIGVGVVNYFSNNSTAAQANQLGSDMSMLIGKVKSAYGGQYGNVTNARLNTGGFFAKLPSLTNNAGVVTTSLGGGTLTVAPGTVTTANDSVRYTITQLPDDACLPLVTALSKTATTLNIGANVVKAAGALPDPSLITCTGDNTTMIFQVM